MTDSFTKTADIKAINDDEMTATGVVLSPNELDRQLDFVDAEGIQRLHTDAPDDGVMHTSFPDGHTSLEVNKVLDEPTTIDGVEFGAGEWVIRRRYQDRDRWQLVKDGVLGGYSIGGEISEAEPYESVDALPDAVDTSKVDAEAVPEEYHPPQKIVDGEINEISDVDRPAVPSAQMAVVKQDLGKNIFDRVDSRDEFLALMESRGHDREDASELWRYLTRTKANTTDTTGTEKPIVLPNGAEFDDFDACVAEISGDGTTREEAEAICGAGREKTANESAESDADAKHTDDMSNAAKAEYGTDDWVSWDASGGRARGQIVDVTEDGTYDEEISGDVTVEGTDDEPAYLIEVWQGSGDDASPIEEESGRGDTMHVAHLESTIRSVGDPRELEASKSGILASLKSLFGSDDGGNTPEAQDGAAKVGRTLSQRNRRAVMAAIDAQLDILDDAGVDHGMTRFTDRADFAFDLADYEGKGSDEMDKNAPEGETSDSDMTDDTNGTEKSDEPPEWAKSLTDKVEQIDKRVSEMEDGEDAEKSLDDAPDWAQDLAEKVDNLDERVDTVSKATADTQQAGGAEATGDGGEDLDKTERQKRELFFGGN